MVAHILREHERGRPLSEILQDRIVEQITPSGRGRLLEDPRVVRRLHTNQRDGDVGAHDAA